MIRLLMVCVVLLATLSAKMVVSVSVIPQAFFVNKIAGDLVDVNVMVSQGKSPEMYEPSIKQVKGSTIFISGFTPINLSLQADSKGMPIKK